MAINVITNSSHLGERLEGGQYSADIIDGLGGNDTIVGHDGADFLFGNMGNDLIYAGTDDTDLDVVVGGDGNDTAYGGGGGDLMDGGAGDDLMGGGTGNDLMFGDTGVRSFDPYSADWTHYSAFTSPLALLGLGTHRGVDDNYLNSFRQSDSGNDTMWGGSGYDMMFGGWGDDEMGGGTGDDLVVGNRGDDLIYGASGEDVLLGGDENDTIMGGTGDDVIDGDETPYAYQLPSCVDATTWYPDLYNDDNGDEDGVENNVIGPNPDHGEDKHVHSDSEYYDEGAPGNDNWPHNLIDYLNDATEWVNNNSQGGDDLLFGGEGDDLIFDRQGADTVWGGEGDDVMMNVNIDEDFPLDNDTDVFGFVGEHGDDTIYGFNTGEWSEGGNGEWEEGEDVIYLQGASYEGEFQDAMSDDPLGMETDDEKAIFFDDDGGCYKMGSVIIYTERLGLEGGGTIQIDFYTEEDYLSFGAGNIVFDDGQAPNWVDITASYQGLEAVGGGSVEVSSDL
ncbi:calcium-binding protein [Paracoccus sp. SCSIO 75233]|uniref:calcium-binding protein n=1 Tax=Paracoccus sp. SCSIO 75233 TaxID=3017782 RepID=UPI0022F01FB5|nr:calcium-binding protein [Paracoccus sp. SCSIO 75233]WBU55366.1 calcium-binding protein [Paracoccus sp. SCSIO 75233]